MFCEKAALKNFEKFIGKHLWESVTLLKMSSAFLKSGSILAVFPVNFQNCFTSMYKIRKHGLVGDVFILVFPQIVSFCFMLKNSSKGYYLLPNNNVIKQSTLK